MLIGHPFSASEGNMENHNEGRKKRHYIFTDKKNPPRGIMSTILGIIAITAIGLVIMLTFQAEGAAKRQYGTTVLLALIFSLVGIVLGILSKTEKEMFYFFSYLGIILNFLAICAVSLILYAGAYGL